MEMAPNKETRHANFEMTARTRIFVTIALFQPSNLFDSFKYRFLATRVFSIQINRSSRNELENGMEALPWSQFSIWPFVVSCREGSLFFKS